MTIVEYVENVCNVKLLPYQKDLVNKMYEASKEHKQLIYYPSRVSSRYFINVLYALVQVVVAQEEGILSKEIKNEFS